MGGKDSSLSPAVRPPFPTEIVIFLDALWPSHIRSIAQEAFGERDIASLGQSSKLHGEVHSNRGHNTGPGVQKCQRDGKPDRDTADRAIRGNQR